MLTYFFLLFLITPCTIAAMEKSKKEVWQDSLDESFLSKALAIIHQRNPSYKLFNRSNEQELGSLKFLANRLPKNNSHQIQTDDLQNIYLATLRHVDSLNTADETNKKAFLIDIQRLYILPLHKRPENTEQKINALSYYYKKTTLNYSKILEKIPEHLRIPYRNIFATILGEFNEHRPTNIIVLDKTTETGFFVLFRLQHIQTNVMSHIVYELTTKKECEWDETCNSLREYYIKHRDYFIKQYPKQIKE